MRAWWLLPLLLVASCSTPEAPRDHYYRLTVPKVASPLPLPALPGILEVKTFFADGLVGGRPLAFAEAGNDSELHAYHYHFWNRSPALMLRDLTVDFLRSANVARQVLTPEVRARADYELIGQVLRLERVRGTPGRVVVELDLALRADQALLFSKRYVYEEAVDSDAVLAAVLAFDRVVQQIYDRFLTDLMRSLPSAPPSPALKSS